MILRYDHPNVIVRRELGGRTAAAASGTNVPLMAYAAFRLVAVHGQVAVAGTSVGSHTYEIRADTGSIGILDFGTQAIGVTSSLAIGSTIAQYGVLNALKGLDATGTIDLTYEYEVLPDSVLS